MAVSTNQGMVGVVQGGGVGAVSNARGAVCVGYRAVKGGRQTAFWAWAVSIGLHLAVLTAFGVVRFSRCKPYTRQEPGPTAKISRIERLARAAPVIPKPKIKKVSEKHFVKSQRSVSSVKPLFDTLKPRGASTATLTKGHMSHSVFSLAGSGIAPQPIEFFGSFALEHKICYVVDCSGSMKGIFSRVQKKLKESIRNLRPDHYFYIIFFGNERLLESGDGRLVRAGPKAKSAAYAFIESVQPAGRTNALAATERAVQIRDAQGRAPSTVYLLTDGFELTTEDAKRFSAKIANLQKQFAPTTRINTIAFWPQSGDREILESVAEYSGGEFVVVDDHSDRANILRALRDANFLEEGGD